jgi:hypothetical protein
MSEYPSSTGVQAKIRRWFDDPSNALIAKPSPEKWLWMYSAILFGSSLCTSGQPVRNRHSSSTASQLRHTGVTVAPCT